MESDSRSGTTVTRTTGNGVAQSSDATSNSTFTNDGTIESNDGVYLGEVKVATRIVRSIDPSLHQLLVLHACAF